MHFLGLAGDQKRCPLCKGKGGLGTFGPVPKGDMFWKMDCPNCDGEMQTLNILPCAMCKAKVKNYKFLYKNTKQVKILSKFLKMFEKIQ